MTFKQNTKKVLLLRLKNSLSPSMNRMRNSLKWLGTLGNSLEGTLRTIKECHLEGLNNSLGRRKPVLMSPFAMNARVMVIMPRNVPTKRN